MEKILTKTPIVSCCVFLAFIILFNILTSHYRITVYETLPVDNIEVNMESNNIVVENSALYEIKEGMKMLLVYSTQEQVLKGTVIKVKDKLIHISFEHLDRLTEEQILQAEYKYAYGKKAIGENLKLWD